MTANLMDAILLDAARAVRLFRTPLPAFEVSTHGCRRGFYLPVDRHRILVVNEEAVDVSVAPDDELALALLADGSRPSIRRCSVDVLAVSAMILGSDDIFLGGQVMPLRGVYGGFCTVGFTDQIGFAGTEAAAVEEMLPEVLFRAGWSSSMSGALPPSVRSLLPELIERA